MKKGGPIRLPFNLSAMLGNWRSSSALSPPPPVSNERLVQGTLLFGPYFLRTLLFAGHGGGGVLCCCHPRGGVHR